MKHQRKKFVGGIKILKIQLQNALMYIEEFMHMAFLSDFNACNKEEYNTKREIQPRLKSRK